MEQRKRSWSNSIATRRKFLKLNRTNIAPANLLVPILIMLLVVSSSAKIIEADSNLIPQSSLISVSVTMARVLTRINSQCSVSVVLLKNNNDYIPPSEMLKSISDSSVAIGMIHPNQTWSRLKYFAKKRNSCHYVVVSSILVDLTSNSQFTSDFQRLVQFHDDRNGILMRDKDYFIFITSGMEQAERILLSDIREKIRYKVAFFQESYENVETSIVTVIPYVPSAFPLNEKYKWGQIHIIATFKSTEHFKTTKSIFIDFTWNFRGYPMKMAVFSTLKPTYEVLPDVNSPGHVIAKRGFFANLTETIHAKLNISCSVFLCHGGGKFLDGTVSGLQLPNSTWIGCMGDVVYNRAQISIAAPVLNRFPFVDFLPKHKYDFIKFVSRQPKKIVSWTAFYKAFRPLVWAIVLASGVSTAIFFWIGLRIQSHADICLGQILTNQLRVLLCQDVTYPSADTGVTTKALWIVWILSSLIIGTAYNSKLTALMSIPKVEPDFPTNFKDLSISTHFQMGAPKSFLLSIGGVIFKRSKSPTMRKIYGMMDQDEDFVSCMRRALTSNYACVNFDFYHDFETGVVFADNRGVSPFFESSDMFNFLPLTQIVRKREVFQESYGYFLENAHHMGHSDKWANIDMLKLRLERIKNGSQLFKHYVDEHVKSLTISNFLGSFIILATGSLIGAFTLSFELCLNMSLWKRISTATGFHRNVDIHSDQNIICRIHIRHAVKARSQRVTVSCVDDNQPSINKKLES